MATCPHCGEELPPRAVSCRHCGSDAETGWTDDVDYHSVEIPDYLLPDAEPRPASGVGPVSRVILVLLALTLLGPAFYWLFHQPTGPHVVIFVLALVVIHFILRLTGRLKT